jgi:hypothetical protein
MFELSYRIVEVHDNGVVRWEVNEVRVFDGDERREVLFADDSEESCKGFLEVLVGAIHDVVLAKA